MTFFKLHVRINRSDDSEEHSSPTADAVSAIAFGDGLACNAFGTTDPVVVIRAFSVLSRQVP
jgi:hypothetical protein